MANHTRTSADPHEHGSNLKYWIVWILKRNMAGEFSKEFFTPVDISALYWHLVDLIWIYLFPLLYLID